MIDFKISYDLSLADLKIHPVPMKLLCLLVVPIFMATISCEQHSWEETKKLHEHGDHDHHHGEEDKSH